MNQDLATTCVRSRDLIRLGFDSASAWKFVFVKWFPENPVCTQDVTLLLWAKLQQVSAAPRYRKLLHKERRNELIKCTIGTSRFWEIGFDQDSNLDLRGANWPETRLQTRLAISSFSRVSQNCQLSFFFNTQISLGTDTCFSDTKNEKMQRKFLSLSNTRQVICLS